MHTTIAQPRTELFLLATAESWRAAARHWFYRQPHCQLHCPSEWQSWLELVRRQSASLSLVEIRRTDWVDQAQWIHQAVRHGGHHRVIALLSPEVRPAEPWLRESGVAVCVRSPSEIGQLDGWLQRHAARIPPLPMPLKDAIIQRLPWNTENDKENP